MHYANWFNRVGSWLIDWVPPVILYTVATAFGGFRYDRLHGSHTLWFVLFAVAAFVVNGYNRWYRAGTTGQSWGKVVTKSHLLAEATGKPMGFVGAFVRDLCHIFDDLCGIFPLGYLWPIWDRKRQTFADKIMKTIVLIK